MLKVVRWACTPGLVPGDRKEKEIKDWNSNRQTAKDRGDRIHEMTETKARESGFKHAIVTRNTHATKTMMRTGKTRTGIKTYEKDDVHFIITLTDDLSRIQVSGYIYTIGDNNLIPSDIVKSRVVYGNAKPGIDLNHCIRTAMRR
ncbi:hypothetical protein PG999_008708 [Apiospora kogelbergensis]|uniref:Uncharacterized protein n=1 Tax=Apiospora kogelbergensis TaxID=1337665 RepID=A0AAW0QIF6_9PEZI